MKKLLPIYIVIFVGFLGFAMAVPLFTALFLDASASASWFPDYFTHGKRTILLGTILAMYPLGQFFGSPILGALSDKYGRKTLLIASLCATTLAYFFIALFLQLFSITAVYFFLFLAGFFEGNVTIAQSAIADVTGPEDKNHRFGYIYLSASLAFVVGPILGGYLADQNLVSWFTFATPFWLVFLLLLPLIWWVWCCFEETHPEHKRVHVSFFEALTNLHHIVTDKKLRVFYMANFFLYLAIFGYFRLYPMYLVDEYGFGVRLLSLYVAYVSVPIIIVNALLIRPLTKMAAPKNLTIFSAILMSVGFLLVIIFKSIDSLMFTLFFTTFFVAIALPSSATTISNETDQQGQVMGNNQSLQVGSQALAGFLGGLLATAFVQFPLIVCTVCGFIGAAILYVLRPVEKLD